MARRYWSGDVLLAPSHFQIGAPTGYTTATHYLRIGAGWNTRIYLYNYWSWNYGLDSVELKVTFTDRQGRAVLARTLMIVPHGHQMIDAGALLGEEGLEELEGEAIFELNGAGLNPENPIQLIADYEFPDGLSSVHGQGGLTDYGFSQRMHQIHVREDDEWSTAFDVKNHYIGNEALEGRATVELFNAAGHWLTTDVPIPPHGAGARYALRELFPKVRGLLGPGGEGALRVTAPYKMHRLFSLHANRRTGAQSVNHGTAEHNHNYPEWAGIPAERYRQMGCRPVTVAPVILDEEISSRVTLINSLGPPEGDKVVDIQVFEAAGGTAPAARTVVDLPLHHQTTVEFSRLLSRGAFLGHAVIGIPWQRGPEAYPRHIDCIPEMSRSGFPAATHVGSGAFNIQGGNEFFRSSGTRIFARMLHSAGYETEAVMTYPTCGHDSPAVSDTEVALIRQDGEMLASRVGVARNGTAVWRLAELFPQADGFIREGSCTMRVTDRAVRLFGFHVTRCLRGGGVAMDHFFGG